MIYNGHVKRIFVCIALFALCFTSRVYAQDESTQSDISPKRYFHFYIYPASLILSALIAPDSKEKDENSNYKPEKTEEDNTYFTNIYFTFEFNPINHFSIVATPSYQGWNFSSEGYEDKGRLNHDRIGSDLGFRIYFSGDQNPNGFFIQATGGIYYFSREIKYRKDPIRTASYKAVLYQGMGYVGYTFEGGVCLSMGAGYNYYKDKKLLYQYKDEKTDLRESLAQRGLAFDISFSIRIGG